MRRTSLHALLLLALATLGHGAATAQAALPCADDLVRCRTVSVPLDPEEPSLGRVGLFTQSIGPTSRGRTVMVLSGGPGQSTTPTFDPFADPLVGELLGRRSVVVFDARGTGRSGLLRCPELQRDQHLRATRAAEACARRLGDRRSEYGIDEHVADIEAVRRALRIRRLDIIGTSYGTMVALRYAQAFPDRVGRLLLDSVVPPSGTSADGLEIFRAMPRVLTELCGENRCSPYTDDLTGQVADLVRKVRAEGPLVGPVFDRRGRAARGELGAVGLLDVLLEGDFNPVVREALPSAVVAANRGDAAPMLRLTRLVAASAPPQRAVDFSAGAYAAGSCEVLQQPWDPAAPPELRRAQATEAARSFSPDSYRPFDAQTILDADYLALCLRWPAPREPMARASDELPRKPMLMISGAEDLRTPVEEAARLSRSVPTSRHLVVPHVGHSVLGSDSSGCALRAALDFMLVRPTRITLCRGPRRIGPRVPVPPRTADAVKAPRGVPARVGRTVQAIDLSLDDVAMALGVGVRRGGGLRGGSYAATRGSVRMRRYEYVPGIRIDAEPRRGGGLTLRTSGPNAARGRLVMSRSGRIRGVVGGRRVRTRAGAGPPQA
jgi:pimeloyl-ACP methyl ester carboxylesterase